MTKWAEEQEVRRLSLAGGEGDREGGSVGVTGAEVARHVAAGRILVGEAVLVGGRRGGINLAGGGGRVQQGERQGSVGL